MLKLSKIADYSVMIVCFLKKHETKKFSAAQIAKEVKINLPTVSKILKILCKGKILQSSLGVNGGYFINDNQTNISVYEIISLVDGNLNLTECSNNKNISCFLQNNCLAKNGWQEINQKIIEILQEYSINKFLKSNN